MLSVTGFCLSVAGAVKTPCRMRTVRTFTTWSTRPTDPWPLLRESSCIESESTPRVSQLHLQSVLGIVLTFTFTLILFVSCFEHHVLASLPDLGSFSLWASVFPPFPHCSDLLVPSDCLVVMTHWQRRRWRSDEGGAVPTEI